MKVISITGGVGSGKSEVLRILQEEFGTFGADHEDFKEAAQALSTKVVDVSKLVEEKKFPLSRLQEAYEEASKPGMYRVSVMLDQE